MVALSLTRGDIPCTTERAIASGLSEFGGRLRNDNNELARRRSHFRTAKVTEPVYGEGGTMQSNLAQHCLALLQENLRQQIGADAFGSDGRLIDWRHGLIETLADLREAEALQLFDPVRLCQPETATAMALNSFLPWRARTDTLRLAGHGPFDELRFAARCPTGVRGTPPLLDLLATNGERLVAVTARGPEVLGGKRSRLAAAYNDIHLGSDMSGWQALLDGLHRAPGRFRHADAASLLKHAIGLSRTFPNHRMTLLYLFWEPLGADNLAFRRHRSELGELRGMVAGDAVTLDVMSFDELWAGFEAAGESWLREMVAELRARYAVAFREPRAL